MTNPQQGAETRLAVEQCDREAGLWRDCAVMLRNVLNGAHPNDLERDLMTTAIAYDLIRNEDQQKPCPTCGKPKHDYSYWRVTGAGRMLVAALTRETSHD